MKRIPLTQNQFAIVDNKNYEWLSQWNWYAMWDGCNFYAVRNDKDVCGKRYSIRMHREIFGFKKGDRKQIDHRNHNTLDNREKNLRMTNHQQNQWNQRSPKGYCWNKRDKKYQAKIKVNGKQIYLGYFDTVKEARAAYLEAKKEYHKI